MTKEFDMLFSRVAAATPITLSHHSRSANASLLILLLPILCFSTQVRHFNIWFVHDGFELFIKIGLLFVNWYFILQYVCNWLNCDVKSVRLEKLQLFSSHFTLESEYIHVGLTWMVCSLSLIPFLSVKRQTTQSISGGDANAPHYFDGLASATFVTVGLSVVEYFFKYIHIDLQKLPTVLLCWFRLCYSPFGIIVRTFKICSGNCMESICKIRTCP